MAEAENVNEILDELNEKLNLFFNTCSCNSVTKKAWEDYIIALGDLHQALKDNSHNLEEVFNKYQAEYKTITRLHRQPRILETNEKLLYALFFGVATALTIAFIAGIFATFALIGSLPLFITTLVLLGVAPLAGIFVGALTVFILIKNESKVSMFLNDSEFIKDFNKMMKDIETLLEETKTKLPIEIPFLSETEGYIHAKRAYVNDKSYQNSLRFFCSDLESIIVSDCRIIEDHAFSYARNVKDVRFGEGLISIGREVFSNSGLREIIFPKTLQSIGWGAFYGCRELRKVTLSAEINKIDRGAFLNCTKLRKIFIQTDSQEIYEHIKSLFDLSLQDYVFMAEPGLAVKSAATI